MNIPNGYTIRPAEAEHIPVCNAIELDAAAIFPPGSIPEHILSDRVPQDILRDAMCKGLLWVVLDADAHPVGYGFVQFAGGLALLAQLDVRPEHGRRGLGTALVLKLADVAREHGATALYLTTFTHVPWNAPLYARLGFVEIPEPEQPHTIREILEEEHERGLQNRTAMRLQLAPMA